jgi:hypothetical protein
MCDRQDTAKPSPERLLPPVQAALCPFSAQIGTKTDAENPQLYRLLIIHLEAAAPRCFD